MRFYSVEGKELPSVTSVISEMWVKRQLIKWKLRVGEKAANRISRVTSSFGSACHKIVANYLDNDKIDDPSSEKVLRAIERWKKWWHEQDLKVIATEQMIHNKDYAGTVDLIAKDKDGKIYILDWKFGRGLYASYLIQLGAYYRILKDKEKEYKFQGLLVRIDPDKDEIETKEILEHELVKHWEVFDRLYKNWVWKLNYDKMTSNEPRTWAGPRSPGQERFNFQ